MHSEVAKVLDGSSSWAVIQADAIALLDSLPDDSVDLLVTSPPYSDARLYLENGEDMGIAKKTEEWVAWMMLFVKAAAPKVKGLIAINVEDRTENFSWRGGPALLMADLIRAGFKIRKPPIYHRIGIPGSGGPDWWRNDFEFVVCVSRGKLPWSDNTACGHKPKWAPGGEMSHRVTSGVRVNQWGGHAKSSQQRRQDGTRQPGGRPSHVLVDGKSEACDPVHRRTKEEKLALGAKTRTSREPNGDEMRDQVYLPPVLANPGNVIEEVYTATQVGELLGQTHDLIRCKVGGGQMGSKHAHDNEAPFPEKLPTAFVRSFCPPNGVVVDPFAGSGTTGTVAIRWGRRFIGCDLRASQVALATKRIKNETPLLFTG